MIVSSRRRTVALIALVILIFGAIEVIFFSSSHDNDHAQAEVKQIQEREVPGSKPHRGVDTKIPHVQKKDLLPKKPPSELDEEGNCLPKTKLIYLKTHKTGSSTLTNIFHRIALKHHLRTVLPIGDLFLGWPSKERIPTSYINIPGSDTYDMFCSAHARYDAEAIDKIVPNAAHVTVLREPAKHFISSWNYWGTENHFLQKSHTKITMDQVLDDPKRWWPDTLRSDKDLLENSQAFDLGIDHTAERSVVQDMIDEMDKWELVLLTEYMDESLVLLKRKMCWDLMDVVYFALKVNTHKKKPEISSEMKKKIYAMNWADAMLYTHFNTSLWKQVALEDGFAEEVAEMRRLKSEVSTRCALTAEWEEDKHRKALLGELGALTDTQKDCHLFQLDSGGFVKYLKEVSGVPKLECHRQGRNLLSYIFMPIVGAGSDPIVTTLHRYAVKQNLRPGLPPDVNNFSYGYPKPFGQNNAQPIAAIPDNLLQRRAPGPGRSTHGIDVLVSAPFRYSAAARKMVKEGSRVTMLREPIERFIVLWNDKNFALRRQKWSKLKKDITLDEFLADVKNNLLKIPTEDQHDLVNGQAFAFGLDLSIDEMLALTPDGVQSEISKLHNADFELILLAEYMDASLVLLRRFMCWELDMISQPFEAKKPSGDLLGSISESSKAAITSLNTLDTVLYEKAKENFFAQVHNIEIGFDKEIEAVRKARADNEETCADYLQGMDDDALLESLRRYAITHGDVQSSMKSAFDHDEDFRCQTYMLSSKSYVKLLAQLWKVDAPWAKVDGAVLTALTAKSGKSGVKSPSRKRKAKSAKKSKESTALAKPKPRKRSSPVTVEGCENGPSKQFIFLKTHKTGSSTITNIFHRYVLNHNITAALPFDNMYLGWPRANNAPNSLRKIEGVTKYDAFVSGHATWSKEYIRQVVPVGKQVTVLREPVSHFVSSWNHWHPDEHIVAAGGPKVSMDVFLDDPHKYWEWAKWSDKALLYNSFSYDFGLGNAPTQTDIDEMIDNLKNEFDLVLITEHMDESLLMMRDELCWDLEDVLHYSLKVASHHPSTNHKPKVNATLAAKIRKMNYADVQLYAAMNKTFHEKLAKKGPEFYEDLEDFRAQKDFIYQRCKYLEQYEEDKLRLGLAEGPKLSRQDRDCHLMLLDSKGFVKHIKRHLGLKTRECTTVSVYPMKHLAFVHALAIDTELFANFAYRGAIHEKLSVFSLAEKDSAAMAQLDWDKPETLKQAALNSGYYVKAPQVMAESFTKYDPQVLDSLVPGAYFFALVQHPVSHFAALWKKAQAEAALAGLAELSIVEFLETGSDEKPYEHLAANPQLRDLMGNPDADLGQIRSHLDSRYRLTLIVERPMESLILLRRMICWSRESAIHYSVPSTETKAYDLPDSFTKDVQAKILARSKNDLEMYNMAVKTFEKKLSLEIYMEEEITELTAWNKEAQTTCAPLAKLSQTKLLSKLSTKKTAQAPPDGEYNLNQDECYRQLLNKDTWRQYPFRFRYKDGDKQQLAKGKTKKAA
eukprot:m.235536 g.235536  ORF g.235536 m.235536 type:complete len:1514 (+) comp33665_c0_seq2:298-4839(+)